MKRAILTSCLFLLLAVALAGCGGKVSTAPDAATNASAGDSPTGRSADAAHSPNVTLLGEIAGGSLFDVFVAGNYAYVAAGGVFSIYDVSNPATPVQVSYSDTPGFSNSVSVSGNYAYVSTFNAGLRIFDISNPAAPTEVGYNNDLYLASDVFVSGNYAYVSELFYGFSIFNISNPANPVFVGSFYNESGGAQEIVVAGGYAYIAGGSNGMLVVDVSIPSAPTQVGQVLAQQVNNVEVSGNYAYITTNNDRIEIIDISNPSMPAKMGSIGVDKAYQVSVSGGFAYVSSSDQGIRIVDVSNPLSPTLAGNYSVSGSVVFSGGYAYLAAENGFSILSAANPVSLSLLGRTMSIPYAKNIHVVGNYAYVINDYYGLYIIDISNLSSPLVANYPITGITSDVFATGNHAYVSKSTGLLILDTSNPMAPEYAGQYETYYPVVKTYIDGNIAYLFESGKLEIVNISDPAAPFLIGFFDTILSNVDIFDGEVVGNYLIGAAGGDMIGARHGLIVIDVSNPETPMEVGFYSIPNPVNSVSVNGNYAYITESLDSVNFHIIDISNPAAPTRIGGLELPRSPNGTKNETHVSGNFAYIAHMDEGAIVIDISNPSAPVEVGFYKAPGRTTGIFPAGGRIYVSTYNGGFFILNHAGAVSINQPTLIGCAFAPSSVPANGSSTTTLTCSASDADGNLSGVTADLSSIGGASAAQLTNVSGGIWRLTGVTVAIGTTLSAKSIQVTATDSSSASTSNTASITPTTPPNLPPVVSGCSFSPASIIANGVAATTLTCTVTDTDGNLSGVSVDLSAVGGSTAAPMASAGGNLWQRTLIKAPAATAVGSKTITVKAMDSAKKTGTSSATLSVTGAPPYVSGCVLSPNYLPSDGATTTTLTCNATDPNGNISSVTANLSGIGGSAAAPLSFVSGSTWRRTGITAAIGSSSGVQSITTTATDGTGLTASKSVSLSVRVPNSRPVVSGCSFSPASIRSNGIATTTLTCSVSDADGNLSAVAVNLGPVGGSTGAPLANIGGGSWRRTSIKSLGIAPGAYSITVTAKDGLSAYGSSTATLTIIP